MKHRIIIGIIAAALAFLGIAAGTAASGGASGTTASFYHTHPVR